MDQTLFPNIINFLSTCYPFNQLPDEWVKHIASTIDISYLIPSEQLPIEHEKHRGLYIVRTGAVEQRYLNDSLRARLASGDVFGFSQLDDHNKEHYRIVAIENTLLYKIPIAIITDFIKQQPDFSVMFAAQAGQRLGYKNIHDSVNDNELYLKPISSVVNTGMAIMSPQSTIQQAAQAMVAQHRSSALVMDGDKLLGIVSDRDMTKRVVAQQIDLQHPVTEIMTQNPCTIDHDAPIISAIELMMRQNVRSLPVIQQGKVIGVVTATSLVTKNSIQAVYLVSRIYRQESIEELQALSIQRQSIFEALVNGGMHPRRIQQMMTLIADAFNRRLLQLAEKTLGKAPIPYAWFVAGAQARHEINYLSDQDNGLILLHEPDEQHKIYFRQLAEFVCYGLEACGYTLCPAHMMATNPKWNQPLSIWENYYKTWILQPETEALLTVSVFLDLRCLYGDKSLLTQLLSTIHRYSRHNKRLYKALIANSLRINPPLGIFRQFVLEKEGEKRSVFNIKKNAINLIIELARVYALAGDFYEMNTENRLKQAAEAGIISQESYKELLNAFYFLCQVRFNHQRDHLQMGTHLTHNIDPNKLTPFDRNHLKDAFRIISTYQESALLSYEAKGALV